MQEDDVITVDVERRRLDVDIGDTEIHARLAAWKALEPRYTHGVLAKYARLVADASHGAVTNSPAAAAD